MQLVSENGTSIQGDGNDVAIITVKVLDAKGRVVPTAENGIHFDVRNGKILGVGNGNPCSQEPDVFLPAAMYTGMHLTAMPRYLSPVTVPDNRSN